MRWKSLCWGLALLLAFASGCKQQCFVTEGVLNEVQTSVYSGLLENKAKESCQPVSHITGPPPTLDDLDRKIRYISLQECIAIALEQGSTGSQNLFTLTNSSLQPNAASNPYIDPETAFTGRGISTGGNDSIRILALDPARAGAEIEGALSKFDAVFFSSVTWNGNDTPIGTPIQTFQAGTTGLTAIESVNVTPTMSLLKPMASGGVAAITFDVPYSYTNLPARVNPSYQPQLQFQFEQPLLQGFGVEINQLRAAHPGSILNPGVLNSQTTQEGILVTRIRFDEQRADFDRLVNLMLINTEIAYWNLYYAYWNLYAQEQALRHTFEVYKISRAGYEAGRTKAADFYQTRGQYEQFRAARLNAINLVLDSERQLRGLLGLPIEDGCRLMPSDEPTLAPFKPDWETAAQEALEHKPELVLARHEVRVAQLNVVLAKNQLLPDLRFLSSYDFNSIGNRLDGQTNSSTDPGNAFRNLSAGGFSNWSVGLRGVVPLGFRFANFQIRQANIQLARSMEVVKDQETKSLRFLGQQYRLLSTQYESIKANRAQREAFGEQLKARYQEFIVGRSTLDPLLEAQRFWATALAAEYNSIALYNIALAGFQFAKGTLQQHDNVVIAEGQLPQCASVRAVEHQRERTASIVLRERAKGAASAGCGPNGCGPNAVSNGATPGIAVPAMKTTTSLPAYLETTPPLKEVPSLPAASTVVGAPLPAPVEAKVEETKPTVPAMPALPVRKPAPTATAPAGPPLASDFGATRPEDLADKSGPAVLPPLEGATRR